MWRCRICAASSRRETRCYERWILSPRLPHLFAIGRPTAGGICLLISAEPDSERPVHAASSRLSPKNSFRPADRGPQSPDTGYNGAPTARQRGALGLSPRRTGYRFQSYRRESGVMPRHLAEHAGITIHFSNCQIPFPRVLNLIHLARALFDNNVVPISQCPSELGLFSFQNLLERLRLRR